MMVAINVFVKIVILEEFTAPFAERLLARNVMIEIIATVVNRFFVTNVDKYPAVKHAKQQCGKYYFGFEQITKNHVQIASKYIEKLMLIRTCDFLFFCNSLMFK